MIPKFALLVFITLVPACWLLIGLIGIFLRSDASQAIRTWRSSR